MSPHRDARPSGWVSWFETRGVTEPGTENEQPSLRRDFGWLFAAWVLFAALLVLFFVAATH